MILQLLPWIITAISLLFAARCYRELWKWAKQCQRARIAIAYNRRVQLDAPLVEWLSWANALGKDEGGRTVYKNNHLSVSILRPRKGDKTPKTTVKTIRNNRRSRKGKVAA